MRYCTKCGQPIPDASQKFCANCGAPVDAAGQSAGQSTGAPASAPGIPAQGSLLPLQAGLSDKNKKIVILVVVLLACALIGTLIRVISNRASASTSTSVSATQKIQPQGGAAAAGNAPTQDSAPWTDGVEPADPNQVQKAEDSNTQVLFRNVPASAILTVDGRTISFSSIGDDAVVSRDVLPDLCVVRAIVPQEDGSYQTAAAWYNYRYGNDLTLGDPDQYGAYTDCDETGLCEPSYKIVDVLTWAYYTGYLNCINNQTMLYMAYSTQTNNDVQQDYVFSEANAQNEYDLSNYQAVCSQPTIEYSNGLVRYNGSFVSYATNRETGLQREISNHRTIELVWQDGMWMVNRMAFLSDDDFNAGRYAALP